MQRFEAARRLGNQDGIGWRGVGSSSEQETLDARRVVALWALQGPLLLYVQPVSKMLCQNMQLHFLLHAEQQECEKQGQNTPMHGFYTIRPQGGVTFSGRRPARQICGLDCRGACQEETWSRRGTRAG